jgi:hypothetical protein
MKAYPSILSEVTHLLLFSNVDKKLPAKHISRISPLIAHESIYVRIKGGFLPGLFFTIFLTILRPRKIFQTNTTG